MTKKTIMAITAHPADVFDCAAGALANHAANGDKVIILSLSHGAFSHAGALLNEITENDQLAKKRKIVEFKKEEFKDAAKAIGATETVIYEDVDDEPITLTKEIVHRLANDIRRFKPDIVITHHPREYNHEDHTDGGEISIRALKAAGRWIFDSDLPAYVVPAVYFYGFQFRPLVQKMGYLPQTPDVIIDIESSLDAKIQSLCAFFSQKYSKDFIMRRLEMIEGNSGLLYGFKYAEWFISMNPIKGQLLPENLNINLGTLINKAHEEGKNK